MSKGTIIPVASGKGGVGKSFLTANLAIALAEKRHHTLVVDLDLGGSNLHSFLGLSNRHPGIGDYLKKRVSTLEDLIVPTGIANLEFIAGQGRTPFLANAPYAQKMRLIRSLQRLQARYIFLDLGAGTSFNTLDFFRMVPRGLMITTPDNPSIMGMLGFLKHCCLRILVRSAGMNPPVRECLESLFSRPVGENAPLTATSILKAVQEVDPEAVKAMARSLETLRPRIIMNMGLHPDELRLASGIDRGLKNILSLEVDHFGFVPEDPRVRESVREGKRYLPENRERTAAVAVEKIAERILRYWDRTIPESARRIHAHALTLFSSPAEAPMAR